MEESIRTSKCQALYFNPDGNQEREVNFAIDKDIDFVASVTNEIGNFFFAYLKNNKLHVSQYDRNGSLLLTLSAPCLDNSLTPVVNLENNENNKVLVATCAQDGKPSVFQSFRFDFDTKNVIASDREKINKQYHKSIEWEQRNDMMKDEYFVVNGYYPSYIERIGDKIVVIKQNTYNYTLSSSSYRSNTTWYTGSMVVSFYDLNLKLIKSIGLDKTYKTSEGYGLSVGANAKGSYLYVVCNTSGKGGLVPVLSVIDVGKMNFEKIELVDKQGIIGVSEPAGTFWFDKKCFIYYSVDVKERPVESKFQQVGL